MLSNDLTKYILPRLENIQKNEDWEAMREELYNKEEAKRVQMISAFYGFVSSAPHVENIPSRF